jgi:hypothetical protein
MGRAINEGLGLQFWPPDRGRAAWARACTALESRRLESRHLAAARVLPAPTTHLVTPSIPVLATKPKMVKWWRRVQHRAIGQAWQEAAGTGL